MIYPLSKNELDEYDTSLSYSAQTPHFMSPDTDISLTNVRGKVRCCLTLVQGGELLITTRGCAETALRDLIER